jgi:hypothetical protein
MDTTQKLAHEDVIKAGFLSELIQFIPTLPDQKLVQLIHNLPFPQPGMVRPLPEGEEWTPALLAGALGAYAFWLPLLLHRHIRVRTAALSRIPLDHPLQVIKDLYDVRTNDRVANYKINRKRLLKNYSSLINARTLKIRLSLLNDDDPMLLEHLDDARESVRYAAALGCTPDNVDAWERLVADPSARLRMMAARHLPVTREAYYYLLHDRDARVRTVAEKRWTAWEINERADPYAQEGGHNGYQAESDSYPI